MQVRVLRVSWAFAVWLTAACLALAADPVDLNSAPVDVIAKLPGVGMELARKIVEHRMYASMAELAKAGLSAEQIKQISAAAIVKPAQSETPGGLGGKISQRSDPTPLFLTPSHPGAKKRVAVLNFDYGAVSTSVVQLFGSNQDVGKGIAELLVDKLVSDGGYSVIERKELEKIVTEQNFSNSDRADASTAAKIARILGVDAIIIGSITQFGRDDRKTDVGGALGGVTGRFGIGGVRKSQSTAVVQVTGRLIDTSTAEILASVSATGEASRSGTGLLGSGGSVYGISQGRASI